MQMEAKEFLRQPEKLDILIHNKLIEKQQWKNIALGITANMEGERVQTSGSQQKMADAINKCIDIETEIDNLIDRLIEKKKAVVAVIEQLDSPFFYDLTHRKYIQYKTLEQIAEETGRSYDAIKTAHGRALEEVRRILRKKEDMQRDL